MKILIAYYSWQGHTRKVVELLAQKLDAQTERIEPIKQSGMATKAMKAYFSLKSNIKPSRADLSDVDHLIVATPVWADHPTPYVMKYISLLTNTKGKTFSILVEMGGRGADKTIKRVRKGLEKKGMEFVTFAVTVERDVDEDNFELTITDMVDSIKNIG
ncbi:MAG: flavodoxin family protein [Methanobacterium formicicum]